MMLLKSGQEFFKHFILCFTALENSRMLFGVVNTNDILNLESSTLVFIQFFESFLNEA